MSVTIKGLDGVLARLDKNKFTQNANKALNKYGVNFEREAKQRVPKDNAGGVGLAGNIFFTPAVDLAMKVGCNKEYAAYVEFGTGPFAAKHVATLSKEWQDYAIKFYVNGQGQTPAQPFIVPSLEGENRKILLADLQKSLK